MSESIFDAFKPRKEGANALKPRKPFEEGRDDRERKKEVSERKGFDVGYERFRTK